VLLQNLVPCRDSSVGIATRYGLDGPGIESRCGARFSGPAQTRPGAHPASYTMSTGSFPGVKQQGCGVDHPPPSSAEVKERAELYLYSLFRPSWPVLEWTLLQNPVPWLRRWPYTARARVQYQGSPHRIRGKQSDTPSVSTFLSQYHSTIARFAFTHPSTKLYNLSNLQRRFVRDKTLRHWVTLSRFEQRSGLIINEENVQEEISLSRIFRKPIQCDKASHPSRTKTSTTPLRRAK